MEFPEGKKIILFDGVCNLCNNFVQTIIKHDKSDEYRFASLQSDYGQKLQNYLGIDPTQTKSVILYEPGVAYFLKSEAALEIVNSFGGAYVLLRIFNVFPKFLSNAVYDFVAINRYKWFGKQESCMLPRAELKAKFID
ncbi:MAG TPA: DCC1-like thiol-disulfide oxidoreductase family protein [Flavobacterium sp.]|nr:DCC1-like thiol-disulfide oxidoreductase family protein [Flavobacterium sp.]